MTREQAKIYAELSRKDVEQIDKGLAEHYDLIRAFANGAEIEYFDFTLEDWFSTNNPAFGHHFKYRVKPNDAAQSFKPWKPKDYEYYFCVCGNGVVVKVRFYKDYRSDKERVAFGNCFKTREEAEAANERVRAALRGEIATKKEVVESLDGEPLGDYEKELLRVFRKAKLHEYCMIENVVKFESVKGCGIELLIPYDNGRKEFFDAIKKFTKEKEK